MPSSEDDLKVKRISISLQPDLFEALDQITENRGFKSRSQALSEMIAQAATSHSEHLGREVVAGTITLVYDESKPGLLECLSQIQREHINEVLSSQHVLLDNNHTMQVLLVQGPAHQLREIKDELVACKGVRKGNLTLTSQLLPPIHPFTPPE